MFAMLSWLVFGWLVGVVHKWFIPATRAMGGLELAGVGVAGSIIGGLIESLIAGHRYHPAGFLVSVAGACAAVWIYRTYLADVVNPPKPPEST
jgi:uncharacterized membrane protein YeaQ/YmgE (transglycosylase-associated protein family)